MINEDLSNYINHCILLMLLVVIIIYLYKNIYTESIQQFNYLKDL